MATVCLSGVSRYVHWPAVPSLRQAIQHHPDDSDIHAATVHLLAIVTGAQAKQKMFIKRSKFKDSGED